MLYLIATDANFASFFSKDPKRQNAPENIFKKELFRLEKDKSYFYKLFIYNEL